VIFVTQCRHEQQRAADVIATTRSGEPRKRSHSVCIAGGYKG